MNKTIKPMLAVAYSDTVVQPSFSLVSEKLDGIRCIFIDGVAYSRSMKPFPNTYLQEVAREYAALDMVDCEIIVGDKYDKAVLQNSMRFCMSKDRNDEFKIYAFDLICGDEPFYSRTEYLKERFEEHGCLPECAEYVEHFIISPKHMAEVELSAYEEKIVSLGGEGVMINDGNAPYFFGRKTTKNSPPLQKLKRFQDTEAVVVGYEPLLQNNNQPVVNTLGYAERSMSKDGMIEKDALGSIVVEAFNTTFHVGSGWTIQEREELWKDRESLIGKIAKVKYFKLNQYGTPSFPTFLCWRDKLDIS